MATFNYHLNYPNPAFEVFITTYTVINNLKLSHCLHTGTRELVHWKRTVNRAVNNSPRFIYCGYFA